ncbi:MAG: MBL fold metallo-hydrolase [Alphaproteobacteria bacterium]
MASHPRLARLALAAIAAAVLPVAQAAAKCLPIAEAPARVMPAALPDPGTVRLTFLGHSSFLIETSGGASAVTDYAGYALETVPDAVTMNNAHRSHYTDFPDPAITHVLRGWATEGLMVTHDVTIEDLRIWNVPTNVRDVGGTRINGNSIFVFEVDGLCIAHLGHLHHTLTDVHLGELGKIDVLLAPADGGYTLSHDLLVEVIGQIGPSLVIPMHYFGTGRLSNLLALLEAEGFAVEIIEDHETTVSRLTMPHRTIRVLGDG